MLDIGRFTSQVALIDVVMGTPAYPTVSAQEGKDRRTEGRRDPRCKIYEDRKSGRRGCGCEFAIRLSFAFDTDTTPHPPVESSILGDVDHRTLYSTEELAFTEKSNLGD